MSDQITLLTAAKIGAQWMQDWLDEHCCECEYGHTCGRPERQKELSLMLDAIARATSLTPDRQEE